jgi:hypothetical protein
MVLRAALRKLRQNCRWVVSQREIFWQFFWQTALFCSFLGRNPRIFEENKMAPEEGLGLTSSGFPNKLKGFCEEFDGLKLNQPN